jgi:hypothetical protein
MFDRIIAGVSGQNFARLMNSPEAHAGMKASAQVLSTLMGQLGIGARRNHLRLENGDL